MFKTISGVILLIFGLSISVVAQTSSRFEGFSTESGLAGQLVRDITQDEQGFIWFATAYGLSRYDGYTFKNFYHDESDQHSLSSNNLWKLHVDDQGTLWIITDKGLDQYTGSHFNRRSVGNSQIKSITSSASGLWVGTSNGIVHYPYNGSSPYHYLTSISDNLQVNDLINMPSGEIIAATSAGLYRMSGDGKDFKPWIFNSKDSPNDIHELHLDKKNVLWAANKDSLYQIEVSQNTYRKKYQDISQHVIQTIVSDQENMWVGTRRKGLYKIDIQGNYENFTYQTQLPHSVSDNIIASLFVDVDDTLWIGTFNSGVNYRNKSVDSFGLHQSGSRRLDCLRSQSINYINQTSSDELLVGTNSGIYKVRLDKNDCRNINFFESENSTPVPIVYSAYQVSENMLLVGHAKGLTLYDEKNNLSKNIYPEQINSSVYFIKAYKNYLLLGTYFNIYRYEMNEGSLHTYNTPKTESNESIGANQASILADNTVFFATNAGLLVFDSDDNIVPFASKGHRAFNSAVDTLLADENYLWVGNGDNHHLFQFNHQGEFIDQYPLSNAISNIRPLSLQSTEMHLWLASTHGLFRLNKTTKNLKQYLEVDGLQSNVFIRNSSFKSTDGKLFFGGKRGFNAFRPKDVQESDTSPSVVLTELRLFNKLIRTKPSNSSNSTKEFFIPEPIEKLEKLELSHRDYVMSIEFAGLHSSDPNRNQYAYKLDGLQKDWIQTDASNRVATFTNLNAGDYIFRVKAANKDGLWSSAEAEVALNVIVHPAPWLTRWAYTLYALFVVGAIWMFVRFRTRSAVIRSNELTLEVQERTKEIQSKKNLIESLLTQKNEQFANISHEFRTPLTLILGPLEKELNDLNGPKNSKHLKMIERNAVRLLGMVEQILKLTELKKEEQVKRFSYSLNPLLSAIQETFQPLAESKQITLSTDLDIACNLFTTDDALEVMIGNLLSNAIKYTPIGGHVNVKTKLLDGQVQIWVTDTGIGIKTSQQKVVFDRFVRLDETSDIAGIGIGLSIVKELVSSHDGSIYIESCQGEGTSFILSLPTTEQTATTKKTTLQSISHLTHQEGLTMHSVEDEGEAETMHTGSERGVSEVKDSLLIIEDSADMQEYVCSVLSEKYRCSSALRGESGIETAINEIPDLIICDVMMPGINGYEVARKLRADERTSHIPIVLLTAKGDKQSRIQGWDENIDDYMTKPFDERELLIRIGNILSIRNILRQKANKEFSNNIGEDRKKITNKVPDSEVRKSSLNKKEQAFVDKLMSIIEDNYPDPDFQRVHMASKMAVSERQLHRKVQALLNQHPIEMLRDHRLKMATIFLKQGKQVSLVASQCGFSSPSYFSQCFKARFGRNPKDAHHGI